MILTGELMLAAERLSGVGSAPMSLGSTERSLSVIPLPAREVEDAQAWYEQRSLFAAAG